MLAAHAIERLRAAGWSATADAERGLDHCVQAALTLREARLLLQRAAVDAALLDHQLPDGTGTALLGEIMTQYPTFPVIMIIGVADNAFAIEAMKQGAYDFNRKPMNDLELTATLANALRVH